MFLKIQAGIKMGRRRRNEFVSSGISFSFKPLTPMKVCCVHSSVGSSSSSPPVVVLLMSEDIHFLNLLQKGRNIMKLIMNLEMTLTVVVEDDECLVQRCR